MITSRQFRQRTGRKPERDDLVRCNCSFVGQWGHSQCGLDRHGMPMFMAQLRKPRPRLPCLRAVRDSAIRPSPNTRRIWRVAFITTRYEALR